MISRVIVRDLQGDRAWSPGWSCVISRVIVRDLQGGGAWSPVWSCVISRVIVRDLQGDRAWSPGWSCVISRVIVRDLRVIVRDLQGDCAWSPGLNLQINKFQLFQTNQARSCLSDTFFRSFSKGLLTPWFQTGRIKTQVNQSFWIPMCLRLSRLK